MDEVVVRGWGGEEAPDERALFQRGSSAPAQRFDLRALAAASKRAIDVAVALIGLVILIPVLALITAAIWLSSGVSPFFVQQRIGRDGSRFGMLKFRTMTPGADELRRSLMHTNETSGLFKLRRDPRVTRIGRLLRRSSLDELPQLINVVRGQMSLVGPRPLIPSEDELVTGIYRERLQVRPGMTGAWQAIGGIRPPLREMVVMDCLYVENWSLWQDLKILARTIPHVLRLRGV